MTEVQSPSAASSEQSDTNRMMNAGIPLTLKKLGAITVKELELEDLLLLSDTILSALTVFMDVSGDKSLSELALLGVILKSNESLVALKAIAAASTKRQPSEYDGMGISDWISLIKAFKQVTDWEELKDLFMELVPADVAKKALKSTPSTE